LHERYEDDLLIYLEFDLNLWLKDRSTGGLERNHFYYISITTTDDM